MTLKETKYTADKAEAAAEAVGEALGEAKVRADGPLTALLAEIDTIWQAVEGVANKNVASFAALGNNIESHQAARVDHKRTRVAAENKVYECKGAELDALYYVRESIHRVMEAYEKHKAKAGGKGKAEAFPMLNPYLYDMPVLVTGHHGHVDVDFLANAGVYAYKFALDDMHKYFAEDGAHGMDAEHVAAETLRMRTRKDEYVKLKSDTCKDSAKRARGFVVHSLKCEAHTAATFDGVRMHFIGTPESEYPREVDAAIESALEAARVLSVASAEVVAAVAAQNGIIREEYANAVTAHVYAMLLERGQVSSGDVKRMRKEGECECV